MKLNKTIYLIPVILGYFLFNVLSDYYKTRQFEEASNARKIEKIQKTENAIERAKWEFMMLRDPQTNSIPKGIYAKEQEFAKTLPKRSEKVLFKNGPGQNVEAISWQERGPNNLGGRTRAFAADSRNKNIILAGGVSGGIWRSINGGTSWTLVTGLTQLPTISCIVQDPRAGQENTWYAGTGEQSTSSDGGGGASYFGNGIYKSTNNGLSWTSLASTTGDVYLWDNDFEFVNSMGISPATGTIIAAVNSSILRSTNGGTTWTRVLGDFNSLLRAEVTVNKAGHAYAAISSNANSPGIHKSTDDGATWSDITPANGVNSTVDFPTDYPRVVLAHAPSNNNIVYIYAYTPGVGPFPAGEPAKATSFWKYNASLAGTAQWVNRTSNLPDWVRDSGIDSQGGYNLFVIVHPTLENFVIIGGTNLYRSDDGFLTKSTITGQNWIGGYAVINDVSQYANHHADQHSGYFEPGNSDIYYSGHDGGLSKTTDILADPVVWADLDDTYNVTQFYTISLAPEANSTYMSGGSQDNGARFTAAGGLANWTEWQGGGDGAFTDVAPIGDDRVYTSTQNGVIDKFQRDNTYLSAIKPTGSTNPLFINPFILDHNSSSLLYYGAGNSAATSGIWRNNSAITATETVGWSFISSITKATDGQTSAIDVSYTNSANVVYFGTTEGKVYKITNANVIPGTVNISAGLPTGGYVSGIAVDPTNSNNVMVVFSNYSFNSIYYSSNGGGAWSFVEGNLSALAGPSVRSCEIFQVDGVTHYFVGTSIGLYFTLTLNGGATVWTQESASTIGNVICASLDWRSDLGTIAKTSPNEINAVGAVTLGVGTHGRGAFQGTLETPLPVELVTFAGIYDEGKVELQWKTETEVNNFGFDIERKRSNESNWEKIGFVSGQGNSSTPKTYFFSDNSLLGDQKFYYRLKQLDIDGSFEYSSTVEVSIVIEGFELSQNYPNPFNPSTTINYSIPENAQVTVEIFSITGELVSQLENSTKEAGKYSIEFNSINKNISSGMYIYRISAKGVSGEVFIQTKKMLLLK